MNDLFIIYDCGSDPASLKRYNYINGTDIIILLHPLY